MLAFVQDDKTQNITKGTAKDKITCVNMGISCSGGDGYGKNVAMNIDNLKIYTCAPATGLEFLNDQYTVKKGETVATTWKMTPANGYLPYMTYESSNKSIATVDANGVVTGVSAGTVTITATPAASTGLAPITTTVVVTDYGALANTNAGLLSKPFYTNAVDNISSNYPLDWMRSHSNQSIQFAKGSSLIKADGRTYYQMKRNGEEGVANSWAVSRPNINYTAAVLKYDVMINSSGTVYLPSFEAADNGNVIPVDVTNYKLADTDFEFDHGKWYTFEIVLNDHNWSLFVDGIWIRNGKIGSQYTVTCLNMGISNSGGDDGNGKNVCFNIDNMEIYNYDPAATFTYKQAQYTVAVGEQIAPALALISTGTYLPSITYTTSDKAIATVDANGVVEGVSAGTVTITATPAASTGLAPITTTVVVTDDGALADTNSGLLSDPIYTNNMDSITSDKYPLGWGRSSEFAKSSSVVTIGNRTYYQMKRSGEESKAVSWATANPISNYTAAVLKYDLMVDNSGLSNWSIHLPNFTDAAKNRPITFVVTNGALSGTDITLTPGQWYTFEVILSGSDWILIVDGVQAMRRTINVGITGLNMGISNSGGDDGNGKNVCFNIDNMEIYNYDPAATFTYKQAQYTVAIDQQIAPALALISTGTYLPSITYTTSDKAIATVDANGVVTGVAAGTVTITAIPAPSSGLTPVTTTVTVG